MHAKPSSDKVQFLGQPLILLLVTSIILTHAESAKSAISTWTGPVTGGVFNDANNWDNSTPGDTSPTSDQAVFNENTNVDGTITFNADALHFRTVVENSSGTITFDVTGHTWTMTGYFLVGTGSGQMNTIRHVGGTIVSDRILLGNSTESSNNSIEISGSSTVWNSTGTGNISVGSNGSDYSTLTVKEGAALSNATPRGMIVGVQGASHNRVYIIDPGTTMNLGGSIGLGYTPNAISGKIAVDNEIHVLNGASLSATSMNIGVSVNTNDNLLLVSGANSKFTLSSPGGFAEIGRLGNDNILRVEDGAEVDGNNIFRLGNGAASTGNELIVADSTLSGSGIEAIRGEVSITNSEVNLSEYFDEDDAVYVGGSLTAITGPTGVINFNSGKVSAVRADFNNGAAFTIGDGGSESATYQMKRTTDEMNAAHNFADGLILSSNGVLAGNGNVTGDVSGSAGAKVDVGASAGLINVTGNWDNTGIDVGLELDDIASSTTPGIQFDQLNVSGAFTHGGTVTIDLAQLVAPASPTQLKLIGWGSQVGASTATAVSFVGGSALPFAFQADGLYVTVEAMSAVLYGDYNNDGKVDAADYTIYRNNVGQATLTNRGPGINGPVGPDDYAVWKSHFGEGMGSGAANEGAVPEPNCTSLIVGMLAACCTLRHFASAKV